MAIKFIFRRSSWLGVKALFWMACAILLMLLDHDPQFGQKTRPYLTAIVLPIQYLVDLPIKVGQELLYAMSSQQILLVDNAKLRAHELLLESKLHKLLLLERENAQLKELLKSLPDTGSRGAVVAQLLAIDLDSNVQHVVINKGLRQKLYTGQPVLDSYGVMGQIVSVGAWTSRVMLLTDTKSGIPVQSSRNNIRAIAVGLGNSKKLALIHLSDKSDIQVNDLFVSSGLGMRYPVGYPVGRVIDIKRDLAQRFITVIIEPSAHLDQSEQVLAVWPDITAPQDKFSNTAVQRGEK